MLPILSYGVRIVLVSIVVGYWGPFKLLYFRSRLVTREGMGFFSDPFKDNHDVLLRFVR